MDIEPYIPLVRRIWLHTTRHLPPQADKENLYGVALLALVELERAYDSTRGVPFEAYLKPRIRMAIINGIRLERTVRHGGAGRYQTASPAIHVSLANLSDDHWACEARQYKRVLAHELLTRMTPLVRYITLRRAGGDSWADLGKQLGWSAARIWQFQHQERPRG